MFAARVPNSLETADPNGVFVLNVKFAIETTLTSETPAGPVAPVAPAGPASP